MNPEACPTCGQPWPDRKGRICAECDKRIARHDRYQFVGSKVQHRDCSDPQLTKLAANLRQQRNLLDE